MQEEAQGTSSENRKQLNLARFWIVELCALLQNHESKEENRKNNEIKVKNWSVK